jgi:hypothetical protein
VDVCYGCVVVGGILVRGERYARSVVFYTATATKTRFDIYTAVGVGSWVYQKCNQALVEAVLEVAEDIIHGGGPRCMKYLGFCSSSSRKGIVLK